jgi:hypothetical protein
VNTAENPPFGLATYLGIAAAAIQYITAIVILIVGGPVEASITTLVTATGALVTVLGGRYVQANSQIKAAAAPGTALGLLPGEDEIDDTDVPASFSAGNEGDEPLPPAPAGAVGGKPGETLS